jgi:tape measure domain-containing protein
MPAQASAFFKAIADFSQLTKGAQQSVSALNSVAAANAAANAKMSASPLIPKMPKPQDIIPATSAIASVTQGVQFLSSSITQLGGSLGSAGAAGGVFSSALSMIPGPAGAVVAALGAVVAVAGGIGMSFNSSIEQMQIGFKSILKSGPAAEDLIGRIIETAKVTPFETNDLTRSIQTMLGFGIPLEKVLTGAGKEAKGLVIDLGDAAAASGRGAESMQRAMLAVGQMAAKGKVSQEELNQLTEAGIPAQRIMTEELGLSAKQTKNIGDAGISADKAIAALSRGLHKNFGGAMEVQSRTMAGQLSTLSDFVKTTMGELWMGVYDQAKGGISQITELMTRTGDLASKIGWAAALDETVPILGQVIHLFENLGTILGSILPTLGEIAKMGLGAAFLLLQTALTAVNAVLGPFASFMESAPGPVKAFAGALAFLTAAVWAYNASIKGHSIASFVQNLEASATAVNKTSAAYVSMVAKQQLFGKEGLAAIQAAKGFSATFTAMATAIKTQAIAMMTAAAPFIAIAAALAAVMVTWNAAQDANKRVEDSAKGVAEAFNKGAEAADTVAKKEDHIRRVREQIAGLDKDIAEAPWYDRQAVLEMEAMRDQLKAMADQEEKSLAAKKQVAAATGSTVEEVTKWLAVQTKAGKVYTDAALIERDFARWRKENNNKTVEAVADEKTLMDARKEAGESAVKSAMGQTSAQEVLTKALDAKKKAYLAANPYEDKKTPAQQIAELYAKKAQKEEEQAYKERQTREKKGLQDLHALQNQQLEDQEKAANAAWKAENDALAARKKALSEAHEIEKKQFDERRSALERENELRMRALDAQRQLIEEQGSRRQKEIIQAQITAEQNRVSDQNAGLDKEAEAMANRHTAEENALQQQADATARRQEMEKADLDAHKLALSERQAADDAALEKRQAAENEAREKFQENAELMTQIAQINAKAASDAYVAAADTIGLSLEEANAAMQSFAAQQTSWMQTLAAAGVAFGTDVMGTFAQLGPAWLNVLQASLNDPKAGQILADEMRARGKADVDSAANKFLAAVTTAQSAKASQELANSQKIRLNEVRNYADGGIRSLSSGAHFEPAHGPLGVIRYAERPTGLGEAFIPVNGSARSKDIWAKTGSMLGMPQMAMPSAGVTPMAAARASQGTMMGPQTHVTINGNLTQDTLQDLERVLDERDRELAEMIRRYSE